MTSYFTIMTPVSFVDNFVENEDYSHEIGIKSPRLT